MFRLATYSRVIQDGPDRDTRYRVLMHDLPRRFHRLAPSDQVAALAEPPPLTGTRWDSLLAAVVEHVAWLHGHPVPAWVDEPTRFLKRPWVVSRNPAIAADSVLYAPAAFIRHGALPDPLDLDARGGDEHEWVPGQG